MTRRAQSLWDPVLEKILKLDIGQLLSLEIPAGTEPAAYLNRAGQMIRSRVYPYAEYEDRAFQCRLMRQTPRHKPRLHIRRVPVRS